MIVGFYRGIVKVFHGRQQSGLPRTLVVKPWLFFGRSEERNITPNSPGAKLDSYDLEEPWW